METSTQIRYCRICSKKLSIYNETDQCFCHSKLQQIEGRLQQPVKPVAINTRQKNLLDIVLEIYKIEKEGIFSRGRHPQEVLARQVFIFLLRSKLEYSALTIAGLIGCSDNTVRDSYHKINRAVEKNTQLAKNISTILSRL